MPNTFLLGEHIIDYTFRENGAIFIPKAYRKRAVIMQVDIKIVSQLRERYLNYESSPADGYYGYATLVIRDFCLPPIKLSQPRQTVYRERLDDAIVNWKSYIDQIRIQENFLGVESLICEVIGQLNGSCAEKPCVPLVAPVWEEIPLREVYVNTHYGTQFQIELSYIDMNDVVDNCGNYVRAESGWDDGDKDDGLPPNGVFPARPSDLNNPYDGLPPVSGTEVLGVLPPGKQNNLNDVNGDNVTSWYFEIIYDYNSVGNNCQLRRAHIFLDCQRYSVLGQTLSNTVGNVCDRDVFNLSVTVDGNTVLTEEVVNFVSLSPPAPYPKPASYFDVIG